MGGQGRGGNAEHGLAPDDPGDLWRILDVVSDAFLLVDRSWRVTHINHGGRRMLGRIGLDPEKILGGTLWEEVPSDPNGPGGTVLRRAMENGSVESEEAYYAPLDAWFEVTAFPYGGEDEGLVVLLSDITGERETATALRAVEGRHRAMVEHAPHAIIVLDVESETVIDFNQRALELYDRTEEELKDSPPYEFSPERQPDGRRSVDAARAYIRQALNGEVPVFEWIHLRPDGEEVVTEIRLARIPPKDAELIQASVLDITDRRRAEDALREREELYRALFEQDVVGNFVTSAEGELLACNRAFAEIFELGSPEEAVGSSVEGLHISSRGRNHIVSIIETEGRLDYYEFEGRSASGAPLHLVANARGVFDDDGRLREIRGHVVDMTD
ncbi:MAG: PAS domain S-box protein, partial [Gemmatimonadota bacterium]